MEAAPELEEDLTDVEDDQEAARAAAPPPIRVEARHFESALAEMLPDQSSVRDVGPSPYSAPSSSASRLPVIHGNVIIHEGGFLRLGPPTITTRPRAVFVREV